MTEANVNSGTGAAAPKPTNVQELVKAWKVSGRKARVLESRLQQAVEVARRYRRDLLRLAEQNRSRKLQAESLQQKLLQVLEERTPVSAADTSVPEPLPAGDESVPAEYVRHLLQRLRDAQELIAEFEKLLEFREKQVHELLARQAAAGDSPVDWRVTTLQRELTEARHRIRLLTQELSQKPEAVEGENLQQRVAELQSQLTALTTQGDAALQAQIEQRDQQLQQLQTQLATRLEELKKAANTIREARERIQKLEADLAEARQGSAAADEAAELLGEITNLQDEIARLQEENENLARRPAASPPQTERIQELEAEVAALRAASADPTRAAKLEAALIDMRNKLQLAGSKYQEVKAALIEKHQQLVALQAQRQESQKTSEVLEPLVRTLETALEESRRENTTLQRQCDDLKRRLSQAGSGAAAPVEPNEAIASLETKLKEARRSAVRAQAEAGLKRKEMAKMQEEMEALKAKVVALGGTP